MSNGGGSHACSWSTTTSSASSPLAGCSRTSGSRPTSSPKAPRRSRCPRSGRMSRSSWIAGPRRWTATAPRGRSVPAPALPSAPRWSRSPPSRARCAWPRAWIITSPSRCVSRRCRPSASSSASSHAPASRWSRLPCAAAPPLRCWRPSPIIEPAQPPSAPPPCARRHPCPPDTVRAANAGDLTARARCADLAQRAAAPTRRAALLPRVARRRRVDVDAAAEVGAAVRQALRSPRDAARAQLESGAGAATQPPRLSRRAAVRVVIADDDPLPDGASRR